MQKLVFINGNGVEINLTSGNYGITKWSGFSNVGLNVQEQKVPFQDGSVYLDSLLENRELNVVVSLNDENDLEKRYRLKREMISIINPKLGEGILIYTNDFISKRIHCIPEIPLFENKNSNDRGTQKANCSFTACNPYWEDLEETEIELVSNEQIEIENDGDVDVGMKIEMICNQSQNPQVRNMTENKSLIVLGEYSNTIDIDTNTGIKTVKEKKLDFKYTLYAEKIYFNQESGFFAFYQNDRIYFSQDYNDWDYIDSPVIGKFSLIDNTFYILGTTKTAKSKDLQNWNIQDNNYSQYISNSVKDFIFSKVLNKFIAFGDYDLGVSDDCLTWTNKLSIQQGGFMSIAENDSIIVVVGQRGLIRTSTDGETWTSRTSGMGTKSIDCVCYGLGHFVAVGQQGSILYSTDAETWTLITSGSDLDWHSIGFNGSMFIVGGENMVVGTTKTHILTSTDAETWTYRTADENNYYNVWSVSWIDLLAVWVMGSTPFLQSADGINWQYKSGGILNFNCVCEWNNGFLASGNSGTFYSEDGFNWIKKSNEIFNQIYFNPETDVILGIKINGGLWVTNLTFYTSLNSETWNEGETLNLYYGMFSNICVKEDGFCFFAYWYDEIQSLGFFLWCTSNDGLTWTKENLTDSIRINKFIFVSNKFVGIGYDLNNVYSIYSSTDGLTWVQRHQATSELPARDFSTIHYDENSEKFVALGTKRAESSDGINWTEMSISGDGLNINHYIEDFAINENGLYCAGTNQYLYLSYDGINFVKQNGTEQAGSVKYLKDKFFTCGNWSVSYEKDVGNIIANLSPFSDMGIGLKTGKNILICDSNGFLKCKIKFRQKYIGV